MCELEELLARHAFVTTFASRDDALRLALTSPRIVSSLNWNLLVASGHSRRVSRPRRPTLPLRRPRLPTILTEGTINLVSHRARLDETQAAAFRRVASGTTALARRRSMPLSIQSATSEDEDSILSIACGLGHSVGLRVDGTVITWGNAVHGQRNDAPSREARRRDRSASKVPADTTRKWKGLENKTAGGFVAVACGGNHSVGLRDDGTVATWGANSRGQRRGAPTFAGFVAIACGLAHSVGLREDGTVVTWGASIDGQWDDLPTDGDFVAVACGWLHSVGLRKNGTVVTWGRKCNGQRRDAPTGGGIVAVACGAWHSVGLRDDGTVITWGAAYQRQRDDAPTEAGFVAIACGVRHSIGLRDDGTVVAWGSGPHLRRCDAPTQADFFAVACGYNHSVGLREDGTLISWG